MKYSVTPYFLDKPVPGLRALAEPDWFVNEPDLPTGDLETKLSAIHAPLADFVCECTKSGQPSANILGDCCSAIGVLAGLQRAGIEPYLIWLDAHGDFNTHATTPSGFLGGMPLAMMTGRGEQRMTAAVDLNAHPEERVILSDARDLDPEEADAVAASGMLHVREFEKLAEIALPDGPLYVHFDSDVITSDEAPAHNYPATGGPSADIVTSVMDRISRTGRVVAASMSAWNPALDEEKRTAAACLSAFRAVLRGSELS